MTTSDQQLLPGAASTRQPGLPGPVLTERLVLRPAVPGDADATYAYRRLEEVGRWLTEIPTDPASYGATSTDPDRLATRSSRRPVASSSATSCSASTTPGPRPRWHPRPP